MASPGRSARLSAEPSPKSRRRSRGPSAEEEPEQEPEPASLVQRRQKLAELRSQLAECRAAAENSGGATSKETAEAARIVETAKSFSEFCTLLTSVQEMPGGEGDRLVQEHAAAERTRLKRLTQLEQELARSEERQYELRQLVDQLRGGMPPPGKALELIRRHQQNPAVQREYTAMLEEYRELAQVYRLTENLMVSAEYDWLDNADWMERGRPGFHALPPPSEVFRAAAGSGGGRSSSGSADSGS